jgi:hypothetical protein
MKNGTPYCLPYTVSLILMHSFVDTQNFPEILSAVKMLLPKDCLYSLIKSCNYACCISQLTKFHSINPLKPKLVKITFTNAGRTSKKTQYFTSTKLLLALFKETVAVCSENHAKSINTKFKVSGKADGTPSYHPI